MIRYITQKEAKKIDEKLLEFGYSIESLIEIAGLYAFDVLKHILHNEIIKIIVVCGPGNNGSDGLVIARYLQMSGRKVTVYYKKLKHQKLKEIAQKVGVTFTSDLNNFSNFDCIIDSLFGFSFNKPLKEPYDKIIQQFVHHPFIISIDVPSGSDIDNMNSEHKFTSNSVITFVAPKKCLKNCKSVYITKCFVPSCIYNDNNDYINYRKIS